MLALIDADILVYRVGFTTEDEDEHIALWRMDDFVDRIRNDLQTDDYTCYLTEQEKNNFRYAIYPEYKAGRSKKPLHYLLLREHLIDQHPTIIAEGEEADDRMGIDATSNPDTVICSTDKDLRQIPGQHYNFVKQELFDVTPEQGLRWFYHQLLTGDKPVDNIPGLDGIGPKKAEKALASGTTEEEFYGIACHMYEKHLGDDWKDLMRRNGQLLKIRQYEGEIWLPPDERPSSTAVH